MHKFTHGKWKFKFIKSKQCVIINNNNLVDYSSKYKKNKFHLSSIISIHKIAVMDY